MKNTKIDYAVETAPLGTGGGLLLSLKRLHLSKTFLALNGDTFFEVNLANILSHHSTYGASITMSLVKIPENKRYSGVLLDEQGWVRSLKKRSETTPVSENTKITKLFRELVKIG